MQIGQLVIERFEAEKVITQKEAIRRWRRPTDDDLCLSLAICDSIDWNEEAMSFEGTKWSLLYRYYPIAR